MRMCAPIVKLPSIAPSKRFMEDPKDIFEAFKGQQERQKVAMIKQEQMLDDKHIHSSIRGLKFKADLPRLPETFPDAESLKPSKLLAFPRLQELSQQLQASQQKVAKVDGTGMLEFLEVSKQKKEFLGKDQVTDASNLVFSERQPLVKAKKTRTKRPQVESSNDACDIRFSRKRIHQVQDNASEGWKHQRKLRRNLSSVTLPQIQQSS